MNAPDVKKKRKAWVKTIIEYSPEKLVYLDESGVNTDMTRIYGRAMGGAGAVDNAPINTPANTTILSSIRLNGETAYTTYSGGTTSDKLIDYLKNVLIPTLSKGDVIIMDNMRSHHVKAVREAIEDAEMTLLYLLHIARILILLSKCGQKSKLFCESLKFVFLPNFLLLLNLLFRSLQKKIAMGGSTLLVRWDNFVDCYNHSA